MSKLTLKTKKAKAPFFGYEINTEHTYPYDSEDNKKAIDLVHSKIDELIKELQSLGYDGNTCTFSIKTK